MVLFSDKMFRAGVLLKDWVAMVSDFNTPGYLIIDCKTRQVLHTL